MANNAVQFFAEMNDIMNSSLVKMAKDIDSFLQKVYQSARQTFSKIENLIDRLTAKLNSFSGSFEGLKTALNDTEKVVQSNTSNLDKWKDKLKDLNKLSPEHAGGAAAKAATKEKGEEGGGFLKSITGSIAGLFSKGNLLAAGTKIVTGGMDQEKNIAKLAPHLGKEGAAAAYANIKKDAAATPFDTDSLYEANKALINAGASARSARTDTLALANAVSFSGGGNEQLTKMAELMGQVREAGKASGEDLKKFADGGVDVYKALADATGTSVEKAKGMNVTYDQLSGALQKAGGAGGAFAGAMDTQNQTVEAKWGNLTDGLKSGLGDVGVSIMPLLDKLLDFGNKLSGTLLPQIMQAIQPTIDLFNSMPIEGILNDVMSIVSAILAAIGPINEALQPMMQTLFDVLGPLISQISGFIVSLVQQLAPILAVVAHIVAVILAPALRIVGTVIGWVITGISKAVDFIMPILKAIVDFISWVVDGIAWLFGASGDSKKTKALGAKPAVPTTKDSSSVTATGAAAEKDKGLAALNGKVTQGPQTQAQGANKAAGEITSGGPRVININGVKFTDKIELHVLSAKEGLNELEAAMQEMFLRILNSGAAIQ